MSLFNVKNLQELAFDASFKAILATLLLCPGHRYGGDKMNLARCSFIPSNNGQFYKSEIIRQVVKARLRQILVGTMSDQTRMKCVKAFFQMWTKPEARYCLPQIWCFLDAVLDESFIEELKVYVGFQTEDPDARITSMIAQHCPRLQSLRIDLEFPIDIRHCYWSPPIIMRSLMSPLSSLRNLTSLSLECLKDDHKPLLSMIGTSCPRLRRLTIHVLPLNKTTKKAIVLAVLLGELIDKLIPHPDYVPNWSKNEAFEFLVIPPIYLTPVCSTLAHFELQLSRRGIQETTIIGGASTSTLDAFAVRHLPSIPSILLFGYPDRKMGHVVMQSRFEEALRNAKAEIDRFNRIRRV